MAQNGRVMIVGAGIGAGIGAIAKHHDEKKVGLEAEEWLPNDSSAIVAVVDNFPALGKVGT